MAGLAWGMAGIDMAGIGMAGIGMATLTWLPTKN